MPRGRRRLRSRRRGNDARRNDCPFKTRSKTAMHKVTSEIYTENDQISEELDNGNAVTEFTFKCPSYMIETESTAETLNYDSDDDLDVDRDKEGVILIEHSVSTELNLVGLQVWRAALLLADYILSHQDLFRNQIILELGSGVGLTSIVASYLAKEVICTDINVGDILNLIERNFLRNYTYIRSGFHIEEVNFLNLEWPKKLEEKLQSANIVLAADVIYDDKITDGFVRTLTKLLYTKKKKIIYIALEKRYVFTVADLDTIAPMYEEFLRCVEKYKMNWSVDYINIDFPRYFKYDRVKHLVLMKIQNNTRSVAHT
ncbi:PREDICTED: methyltransferase-like protein 22 isoform X2 [Trachymyrmex cornetzi]|uniref:methyltransferase-like protein 22 isoform X2 n=1 Tax=Trachymyrmex cornetzi TaxID=471704 RepID=UPI00084F6745|nr:PREDICTED: methyltransferase-like protein 22 isoform X2 [Trachymyrmex cornetzi]